MSRLRRWVWVLRTLSPSARRWALRRQLESPASRQRRLHEALQQLSRSTTGRLVFVCHGNIMRSAFATEVARAAQPAYANRIVGAGTHAKTGRQAQDSAIRVAPLFGMSLESHTASDLTVTAITADDVVVCMDVMNEANVLAREVPAERVFLVRDINGTAKTEASSGSREVHDPYGKGDAVTTAAFCALAKLAAEWARGFART